MVLENVDVYRIGVAEQVVHIAQDFLISTHEEDTQVIMLAGFELMDRQGVGNALGRDEVGQLAITVTSHVLKRGEACGTL